MFFTKKVKISKKTNYNISVRGEQIGSDVSFLSFDSDRSFTTPLAETPDAVVGMLEKIILNFQIFFENRKTFPFLGL